MYEGQGSYYLNGIVIYGGLHKAGKKCGKGIEYYPSGVSKYVGDFKDGLYDGCGLLYYDNDNYEQILQYEGQWKLGLAHGMGKYYTQKYLDYDGEWFKDKRSGFGTMYDEQGIVYSGLWSNDIPDDTYKRKKVDNEEIQKPKSHKSTKKGGKAN